jgi:hypothetical protein
MGRSNRERAEAHYRAAGKYLRSDMGHPKGRAHMMRWGSLLFGNGLEPYDDMLDKYSQFYSSAQKTMRIDGSTRRCDGEIVATCG